MPLRHLFIIIIIGLLLTQCATPTSPTGGPPDKTGPKVVQTYPKSGTTNFKGQSIEFDFSDFISRSTFHQAFNIAPDLGLRYQVDYGRKSVKIKFDKPLPDSTTMVFTLGTDMADYHGNKMDSPVTLALSTGPQIDSGKLKGKIISAVTGKGLKGQSVFLFLPPFDLQKKARYTLQTDTSGTVTFTYLKGGQYRAILVDDRNNNKIWDKKIETAQPFYRKYFSLATGDTTGKLGTIYVMPVDTVRPTILGIGVLSTHRLRLRFSKRIPSADSLKVTLTDTSGNRLSSVIPLFRDPKEDYVLYAESRQDLQPTKSYKVQIEGLAGDSTLYKPDETFQGSGQKDTTALKIMRVLNGNSLYPTESLKVLYSKMIKGTPVLDSLKVIQNQSLVSPWKHVEIRNNELIINPDSVWQNGSTYQFRLYNPATFQYFKVEPKIWYRDKMGDLQVTIDSADTSGNTHYVIRLRNATNQITRDTVVTQSPVTIHNLPPLDYIVTVFQDSNKNGKWDEGEVEPYKKPEPFFIQREVPVKSRFTGELHVAFKE